MAIQYVIYCKQYCSKCGYWNLKTRSHYGSCPTQSCWHGDPLIQRSGRLLVRGSLPWRPVRHMSMILTFIVYYCLWFEIRFRHWWLPSLTLLEEVVTLCDEVCVRKEKTFQNFHMYFSMSVNTSRSDQSWKWLITI